MAQSPDHPTVPFLRAQKTNGDPMYSVDRRGKQPRWIVIHDMEFPEQPNAAAWTANYFHTGAGGRSVSSHYCVDGFNDGDPLWQCVLLKDAAWTVGNSQGNDEGINWELAGYASQTRAQWLDVFGLNMFNTMAPIIRSDAARFAIPLRTLTDGQLAGREKGITSHWQMGRVFGGTNHTDPGVNFPWDVFMQIITGEQGSNDMAWWVRTLNRKAYIATGAIAPSGKIAAWYLPQAPQNMSAAHNTLLGSVIVDLPNDDGGGVYDLDPQPFPTGGSGGPAGPAVPYTLNLEGSISLAGEAHPPATE